MRRSVRWRAWKRRQNAGVGEKVVLVAQDGKTYTARADRKIDMPGVLCLDTNLNETLAFLNVMRDDILARVSEIMRRGKSRPLGRISRYFDFSTIKHISPTAALVIAAIFDRAKQITGNRPSTVNEHKWRPEVTTVLQMLGFHELLQMRSQSPPVVRSELRILKFISGEQAKGEELGLLQDALVDFLPEDEREFLLFAEPYAGMLEATLNSHMWAYPAGHVWDHPQIPRWWMTGAIDTQQKRVTLAVYDQGISIPGSLPHWEHWNKLERWVLKLAARTGIKAPLGDPIYDSVAIRLAMALASSRTGLPQHGKGLHTMLEVAERAKSGRLRILSRNGEYIKETGRKAFSRNNADKLEGTLVEWQLQL